MKRADRTFVLWLVLFWVGAFWLTAVRSAEAVTLKDHFYGTFRLNVTFINLTSNLSFSVDYTKMRDYYIWGEWKKWGYLGPGQQIELDFVTSQNSEGDTRILTSSNLNNFVIWSSTSGNSGYYWDDSAAAGDLWNKSGPIPSTAGLNTRYDSVMYRISNVATDDVLSAYVVKQARDYDDGGKVVYIIVSPGLTWDNPEKYP